MAPDAAEELHQLGIAGVEAHPHAGQVRSLGERVDRHHPVEAVLEDRAGRPGPGELGVALVGEDRHAPRPSPRRLRGQVAQAPGGIGGRVRPQHEGAVGVGLGDGVEIEAAECGPAGAAPARPGSRPARRPWRRSGTTPPGTAPCRALAGGAGGNGAPRPPAPWSPHRPPPSPAGRPAARSAAPTRPRRRRSVPGSRPKPDSPRSLPEEDRASITPGGGGSHGVPMEQSTTPPGKRLGELAQRGHPVVGVRRELERHVVRDSSAGHELGEASLAHVVEDDLERGELLAVGLAHHFALPGARRPGCRPGPRAPPARRPGPRPARGRRPPAGTRRSPRRCGPTAAPTRRSGGPAPWPRPGPDRPCSRRPARARRPPRSPRAPCAPPPSVPRRARPSRRPRGRGGRPGAPRPGSCGTPRRAGGAVCARSPRCRSPAPSHRRGGRTAGCGGPG